MSENIRHDQGGAARHAELLEGACAEGVDLGSRSAHIQRLGQSLEASLDELRQKCAALESQSGLQDPDLFTLYPEWSILIQKLEKVIETIRRYECPDRPYT